ncbi:hypothetical protein JHK82_052973 [Glycine max]|nr:hypothetical protein JHK82_052973 [Glycine max]
MTTNLAELMNSVLDKSRNLPIGALVKSTYLRCNALFSKRGREAAIMLASGQVYTQLLNKISRHMVLGPRDNKLERDETISNKTGLRGLTFLFSQKSRVYLRKWLTNSAHNNGS